MARFQLNDIETAFRSSFDAGSVLRTLNPARGHGVVATATLHDLVGASRSDVSRDGPPFGHPRWNRLAGIGVDLACDQSGPDAVAGGPVVIERPPGKPPRCADQGDLLRRRVHADLGSSDE